METVTSIEALRAADVPLSTWDESRIDAVQSLCKQVSAFWPCAPEFTYHTYDKGTNQQYSEMIGCSVRLTHPTLSLHIAYNDREKRYHVYCPSVDNLQNVSRITKREVKNGIQSPAGIGVLTGKKIQSWVTYWEQVYVNAAIIDRHNAEKKQAFLEKIKDLPVKWYGNQGRIDRNGIVLSFTIGEEDVYQTLEFSYKASSTLEAFLLLSDNKFRSNE